MKILLLSTLLLLLTSCQEQSKNKGSQTTEADKAETIHTTDELSEWAQAVNYKSVDSIKSVYREESIKIISADSILYGPTEIAEYYSLHADNISSISSLYSIEANKDRKINYELIEYKTQNGQAYNQLVIWRLEQGNRVREFEFESKASDNMQKAEESISDRRNLWMELCNAHDTESLVNKLYSDDNIYYNHRPLVQGRENLIAEYAYMNDQKYSLTLDPLKMVFVSENWVYEIGQCGGSYNGKYIIIWRKETDGVWRVFIDSNI